MTTWSFHNPVRLHFGDGMFDRVADAIGARSWLLVTHPDAPMAPWRSRLIEQVGEPLMAIDDIEPNPSLAMLRRVCSQVGSLPHEPELIVALGGGSVMDSAKFLAAGRGRYHPVVQFIENAERLTRRALPIIAIPTTAGTGSDLTKWATIWDTDHGRKLSLNRDDLYAEAVFVVPQITASLPWSVTLASGLDALSHALESLWNINANPVTRTFAIAAVREVMEGLRRLRETLDDSDARALLALGATRAGLAFSNTQTALAHNISYSITLDHGVAHGIACSFCLPEVMAAAIGADPECDAALAMLFGNLAEAPASLRAFLDELGVPPSAYDLGIGDEEWRGIVLAAFAGQRGRNFIGSIDRFPNAAVRSAAEISHG